MSIADTLHSGVKKLVDTAASFVKIPIMSGIPSKPTKGIDRGTAIIMGNGPSLKTAIAEDRQVLLSFPRLAVNLSMLTPEIRQLKPDYYLLADIAFFVKNKSGKVPALWEAIADVDWPMTLFLPVRAKKMPEVKKLHDNITVKWYNLTPAEGLRPIMHWIYDLGLAMPRPRNVIIPAIMCLMREGFSRIALIGADHNWSQTLWVTERNKVVSVQPHFYKDDAEELKRAEEIFSSVHIADVYENYAIAFRSYFNVRPYADRRGVKILNCTPGSFIDAFDRARLNEL